jgi:anti-anti-sigma factor
MHKPLLIDINPSEIVPRVTIMRLEGDMSSDSLDSLNKSFERLVSDKRLYVVADMSGVSSFSSSALGELMGGRTILMEQGGNLVLTGLGLDLMTNLNMLGAHKIFTVYSDLRSALAAYTWQYDRHTEQIECSFPPQICLTPSVRHFVGRIA